MTSSKNAKLETEITAFKVRFLKKQQKVIPLENYFLWQGLRFVNIPEEKGENFASIVYDVLSKTS